MLCLYGLTHRLVTSLVLLLVLAGSAGLVAARPAAAHEVTDPALHSVLDAVTPALPAGVDVALLPSVADELVFTNPTASPLEVLATGGEVFIRISASGVEGNLASPDWYTTADPEGGPPVPAAVLREGGKGPARFARVSAQAVWSAFDPRVRPTAAVPREVRAAGVEATLSTWSVPFRLGGVLHAARGHVAFSPVRGALTVTITQAPAGVTVSALQGRLPGLFVRAPAGRTLIVTGSDGRPFLRFNTAGVQAQRASASWLQDQRSRGGATVLQASGTQAAPTQADGWTAVGAASTYSWLDARLRYPSDLPPRPVLARAAPTVVQTWAVPVELDGVAASITGTVTWVPRAVALSQLNPGQLNPDQLNPGQLSPGQLSRADGRRPASAGPADGAPIAIGLGLLGLGLLLLVGRRLLVNHVSK